MPNLVSRCPICSNPILKSEVVCSDCSKQLDSECFDSFMDRCPVCCYPRVAPVYRCGICRGEEGKAFRIYPVARYDGKLSYSIIDGLKFHGLKQFAPVAALYLNRALDSLDPAGTALIVPVPCSSARLEEFGFDHMLEVCKALKRPYLPLLANRSSGVQQKTLDKAHRLENAEGKYRINDQMKDIESLKEHRIIVVDDIITTMSTMNSALKCLRDNGFKDICGASWLAEL